MKKVLLFITMAASLLFAQCKKSEDSAPSEGKTVNMTVTVGPGSKTDITDMGAITWSKNDKLYVGDGGKYVGYLTLANGVGSATGTFTGSVELTDAEEGKELTFHFYYLGSADHTNLAKNAESVEVDFSSQDITKDGNGKLTNASKCHVGYGSAKGTVIGGAVTDINVMLVSKVAIAHFNFKKGDADYAGALKLSGTNICNVMTVNFNSTGFASTGTKGEISLTNTTSSEKYVMLVPTDATTTSQALTFTGANVAGETTLANGIKPNKFYGLDGAIAVTLTSTKVPVESVSLSANTLSLEVGKTATLTATVKPDNATDESVTWISSATNVATVSNGVVTAVAAGTATITVTATNGTEDTSDDKTATCTVKVTAPSYLPGEFTINSGGTKVKFSKGNLWYDGSKFHFESNQWATTPVAANQTGSSSIWTANHVSHFLWSKDKSVAVGTTTSVSGNAGDVFFTNATQTTANSSFQVDGETAGTWRTLSKDEWVYLINTRSETNRFAKAKVSSVRGLLIFPDNYSGTTSGMGIATVNSTNAAYPSNNISPDIWRKMESAGVVFLPAAGYREGTVVSNVGLDGYYWSSAPADTGNAYSLFYSDYVSPQYKRNRYCGSSVRLVR